jgi:transglutaminase-like putative cysteine protease
VRYTITHTSRYSYEHPASESFMEVRLVPQTNLRQTLISRTLTITPHCTCRSYTDYFGNIAEHFSIPHRHDQLLVRAESVVETLPWEPPASVLDVSVSEARQLFRSRPLELYDFLNESPAIFFTTALNREANRLIRPRDCLGEAILRVMEWTNKWVKYEPGSTRIDTRPDEVLASRKGVCQDMAQLMIAVLRSAEIPARYVCGYIETEQQRLASEMHEKRLVGFAESHAWVEIGLPGGVWWGLDPTNNIPAGMRHVTVSVGRDYTDTTPTRGVFKGSSKQELRVSVQMHRI